MPQLDPASFSSQLFWLVVSFSLLYCILYFKAIPNLRKIITERENSIDGNIKKAEEYRLEAEKIEEEYNLILAEAKIEAAKIMQDASTKIKQQIELATAKIDAEMAARLTETEAKVSKVIQEAEAGLATTITPIATAIISKITSSNPDENILKTSVQELLQRRFN